MSATTTREATSMNRLIYVATTAAALMFAAATHAAAPGITGPTFNLVAGDGYINQPDGNQLYSWGYGCNTAPAGFAPTMPHQFCPTMQIPAPTLIVHEGDPVTVNLTNSLPAPAGNTSILCPGFNVSTSCSATAPSGAQGLLTCEATHGSTVTDTGQQALRPAGRGRGT